jgi:hypothetical protein
MANICQRICDMQGPDMPNLTQYLSSPLPLSKSLPPPLSLSLSLSRARARAPALVHSTVIRPPRLWLADEQKHEAYKLDCMAWNHGLCNCAGTSLKGGSTALCPPSHTPWWPVAACTLSLLTAGEPRRLLESKGSTSQPATGDESFRCIQWARVNLLGLERWMLI